MPSDAHQTTIKSLLIRCRAVMQTCFNDTPDDLDAPERKMVLARRIEECTDMIKQLENAS